MKYKEIRIYPSVWTMDVIISNSEKDLKNISEKRYGIFDDPIMFNQCCSIHSEKKGELNCEKRVVLSLKSLKDKKTIVHELIHAIWHISEYVGYEMSYNTQEWQAVLFEYLYDEILKNNYVDYK